MKNTTFFSAVCAAAVFMMGNLAYSQDQNGDGDIDKKDSQEFLRKIASGTASSDRSLDVNNDGTADLKDALLYGQWINGLWNNPSSGTCQTLYLSTPQDTVAYNTYQKNLKNKKEIMTAADLKKAYPNTARNEALNYDSSKVEFVAEVNKVFKSQEYMARVLKDGMAVTTKQDYPNFYSAFDMIHTNDLPVIFTTDALLQTIYRSYDNILMQLETNNFTPSLDKILLASLAYLNTTYGKGDNEQNFVSDVRMYFETGLRLLKPGRTDLNQNTLVDGALTAIKNEQMQDFTLFGAPRKIDFSQFLPRGHYTKSPELTKYFKTMMWLGRSDLAFQIGGTNNPAAEERMKKGALVTWDCVVNSGALPAWIELNSVIEFMVGTSDGLSIKGMGNCVHDMGITDIPSFIATFNTSKFDSALANGGYGTQLILSEFKEVTGLTDKMKLARIFNFFPQRFIIDSYTFSQVVYPHTKRLMPSSLDMAFVLGDNTALDDHPDLQALVPGVLSCQRQLYDEISPAGWQSNMYTSWLNFLRKLNGVENNPDVSPVFRTLAWAKKMRNAQLTSWAHLRHNTILYSKQSYTASPTCSHPKAYVEPYPDFFAAVTAYANKGATLFSTSDQQISGFFKEVAVICTQLADIAKLTAKGKEPTEDQVTWLRQVVSSYSVGSGGYTTTTKVYDGWYFDLIYDNDASNRSADWVAFTTIADVHTKPADDNGPAKVLHAATGYINLMTVVVKLDTCTSLFVGPVGSYYDVTTTDATSPIRLTNEDWQTELEKTLSGKSTIAKKPDWTSIYAY